MEPETNTQSVQEDRSGDSDHIQHRAPEGQGTRAPFKEDEGPIQNSIFDGAGNEVVVVTHTDAEGQRKQGTGTDAAEALADAQDKSEPIGEEFGTTSGQGGH